MTSILHAAFPSSDRMRSLRRLRDNRYARWAALGFIAVVALGMLLFHVFSGLQTWTGGSAAIALFMVLGVMVTSLLGFGLMGLAFYSARRGFDDPASTLDK